MYPCVTIHVDSTLTDLYTGSWSPSHDNFCHFKVSALVPLDWGHQTFSCFRFYTYSYFWQYWKSNSRPHTCYTNAPVPWCWNLRKVFLGSQGPESRVVRTWGTESGEAWSSVSKWAACWSYFYWQELVILSYKFFVSWPPRANTMESFIVIA
jgi:hypothetical protein